jgi:hypothetical protein
MPKLEIIDQAAIVLRSIVSTSQYAPATTSGYSRETQLEALWNSVVSLPESDDPVQIPADRTLGNLMGLLGVLYTIMNYFFIFSIIWLAIRFGRLEKKSAPRSAVLNLSISLGIFLFGIALLSIGWGFQADLSLYNLPGIPVFNLLGIFSILLNITTSTRKVSVNQYEKF